MNASKTPPSPHVPTLTYAKQWVKKHHRDVSEKESMYLTSTIYNFLATLPDFRSILEQCVMGDVRQTIELPAHASNDNMTATLPAPIADPPVPTPLKLRYLHMKKATASLKRRWSGIMPTPRCTESILTTILSPLRTNRMLSKNLPAANHSRKCANQN